MRLIPSRSCLFVFRSRTKACREVISTAGLTLVVQTCRKAPGMSTPSIMFFCQLTIIRGRLVLDRNTKLPKLNCRNWECGVLLPLPQSEKETLGSMTDGEDLQKFDSRIPVPMAVPSVRLLGKRPWFFGAQL